MSSFEARRALSVCLAAAVSLGAFGCNSDDEFVEPEVTSDNHEEMLSAAPGPGEKLGKADDLRDSEPAYMFTSEPSDVDVLPAEFDTAQTLFIGWANGAFSLENFFVEMVREAATEVPELIIITENDSNSNYVYSQLANAGTDMDSVQFAAAPLDSIWMRDYGPLFVNTTHGGQRIIDPRYYYGRFSDDVMPTRMAYWWDMDVSRPPIDMEGGNFQSDGAGRCITTEMVLWQNNERHYDEQDIKQLFQSYYGCSTTVILPTINGEGTGHVAMYATITGPGQVIVGDYSWEDDSTNAARLDSAATELEGAGFSVRRIPMPSNADGAYRSYTNSLAIGNKVLVPIYYDDRRYEGPAISTFEQAYPNKTIVPIDATNIIQWSGAIHCVTMTVNK